MQGVPPFAYQGFDVLSWLPDGVTGKSGEWTTPLERVDVPSGAFAVTAPALHPVHGTKARYRCLSRADHALLRPWLDARLGRYGAFWCPTFQRDMDVVDAHTLGTWVIRTIGFAAAFAADPSACYLYGFKRAGTFACTVKVTAAVDNGDGTETLTYNTTDAARVSGNGGIVVYTATLTSVTAASLLRFARLDADTLTETWATPSIVDLALTVASITGEQP